MRGVALVIAVMLVAAETGSAAGSDLAVAIPDGGATPVDGGPAAVDAGRADLAPIADAGGFAGVPMTNSGGSSLPALPPVHEPPAAGQGGSARRGKRERGKPTRTTTPEVMLESQNHLQSIARRYAQLVLSRRFDEARLLHEEEGGRRPDWTGLRAAAVAALDAHGLPRSIDQSLTTWHGSELTTFFFTAIFADSSELPLRVAIDHWGHVAGAGIGGELVPAMKKRYDRNDEYKTRTELALPFHGVWVASNATLAPGNGHYLNANQRFAVDFSMSEETGGKRKSYRDRGRQNTDYFSYGQDVLAPADGVVVQVVDGIPDNSPGQVDVYYRLGNSVVISFENGEYAYLCHLMPGAMRVRPGDRVGRGQVVGKCGNSGNSTGPHLHFQLTDHPQVSHAASLPAYFRNVRRNGVVVAEALPQSGERLENAADSATRYHAAAAPAGRSATSQ